MSECKIYLGNLSYDTGEWYVISDQLAKYCIQFRLYLYNVRESFSQSRCLTLSLTELELARSNTYRQQLNHQSQQEWIFMIHKCFHSAAFHESDDIKISLLVSYLIFCLFLKNDQQENAFSFAVVVPTVIRVCGLLAGPKWVPPTYGCS